MEILGFLSRIFDPLTRLVDDVHTSQEEKLILRNELSSLQNRLSEKFLDFETKRLDAQQKIIVAEAQGQSWLHSAWAGTSLGAQRKRSLRSLRPHGKENQTMSDETDYLQKIKNWWDLGKFLILALFAVVVLWADSRYLTQDEARELTEHGSREHTEMEERYKSWRDSHESKIQTNAEAVSKIDSRLSRIEAQNDLILKYLETGGHPR